MGDDCSGIGSMVTLRANVFGKVIVSSSTLHRPVQKCERVRRHTSSRPVQAAHLLRAVLGDAVPEALHVFLVEIKWGWLMGLVVVEIAKHE